MPGDDDTRAVPPRQSPPPLTVAAEVARIPWTTDATPPPPRRYRSFMAAPPGWYVVSGGVNEDGTAWLHWEPIAGWALLRDTWDDVMLPVTVCADDEMVFTAIAPGDQHPGFACYTEAQRQDEAFLAHLRDEVLRRHAVDEVHRHREDAEHINAFVDAQPDPAAFGRAPARGTTRGSRST